MTKNSKLKYLWIPVVGLTLTALVYFIPLIYGAGKAQASLVAKDIALAATDKIIIEDLEQLDFILR